MLKTKLQNMKMKLLKKVEVLEDVIKSTYTLDFL